MGIVRIWNLDLTWFDNEQIGIVGNDAQHDAVYEPVEVNTVILALQWIGVHWVGNISTFETIVISVHNHKMTYRLAFGAVVFVVVHLAWC